MVVVVVVMVLLLAACRGTFTAATHHEEQVLAREDIFVDACIAIQKNTGKRGKVFFENFTRRVFQRHCTFPFFFFFFFRLHLFFYSPPCSRVDSTPQTATMRAACALNPAAGCAPSTSGRMHVAAPASAAAAAPTCSQKINALSRRRRHRRRFPAAAKASSEATDLMPRQAFDIDPLPSKRGFMPNTFPSAVLSAQEVRYETEGRKRKKTIKRLTAYIFDGGLEGGCCSPSPRFSLTP